MFGDGPSWRLAASTASSSVGPSNRSVGKGYHSLGLEAQLRTKLRVGQNGQARGRGPYELFDRRPQRCCADQDRHLAVPFGFSRTLGDGKGEGLRFFGR